MAQTSREELLDSLEMWLLYWQVRGLGTNVWKLPFFRSCSTKMFQNKSSQLIKLTLSMLMFIWLQHKIQKTFWQNFLILLDCRNKNVILWFLSNIGNWIFNLPTWNGMYWLITRSRKSKNVYIFQTRLKIHEVLMRKLQQMFWAGWRQWRQINKVIVNK